MHKNALNDMYLDYFNNYLTVGVFAKCNGLTVMQALKLIKLGKEINQYKPPTY